MRKKLGDETTKNILLAISGGIVALVALPFFAYYLLPKIIKKSSVKLERNNRKKFYDTFYHLRKKGLIKMEYRGKQLYVHLSEKGRKLAKKYQIDNLKIKKPKKWDKKWRIIIFDIPDEHKIKREALRGKLKELNFFKLQKSVWVCPYEFKREVELIRNFFALSSEEMKIIIASEIENDKIVKEFFKINKS
ncbi:MAG: hypothetical protein A3J63_00795 [Candidatus Moranbacteria bacterium RIFCSPHIGHO2_02_FULL_40_12b]|nr:MAG: hypothetical protein A3J63_00795 [Candidatus Moranbacteria bacterium RIFCSPHIGHO2_02_FULL_40_12b]OGI24232.1 MAG: hypothetical protein A3E91_02670 [Candidatus Moranbacteria bacterium RIFCSPHIGHO2_12_FULL_40_10]